MQDTDMSSLIFWGQYEDEQDREIDSEVESEDVFPDPDEIDGGRRRMDELELTEQEAILLMGWEGAVVFGQPIPPMRDFLPDAYSRWYDRLINEVLPAAGHEAIVAFIEAEFNPLVFFQRHASKAGGDQ